MKTTNKVIKWLRMRPSKRSGGFLMTLGILTLIILGTGCQKVEELETSNESSLNATAASLGLEVVAEGLVSPLTLSEAPDGSKRLFIVDQVGKIWILDSTGNQMPEPLIDLSSKLIGLNPGYDEKGLLGLAFDPDFKDNGRFFVYYTAPPRAGGPEAGASWNHLNVVSQFTLAPGANTADLATEKIVLQLDHPQTNHNGGSIAFGPDGYLYIAIGDGGNSNDVGPGHVIDWYKVNEGGNGQDVCHNLLGNILRVDVSSGNGGYTIPSDNPFIKRPNAKHEIYAYGFRNPYSFSFDQGGTNQLYAGDAGQSLYEEINIVTKGGNYGWNVKEGTRCFSTANNLVELGSCPIVDELGIKLTDPVIELANISNPNGGIASVIVAGHVYRGSSIPELQGKYIFGTFSEARGAGPNGRLYVSTPGGTALWSFDELGLKDYPENLGQYVKGFGQGLDGEIYVLVSTVTGPTGNAGKVLKLAMVP